MEARRQWDHSIQSPERKMAKKELNSETYPLKMKLKYFQKKTVISLLTDLPYRKY